VEFGHSWEMAFGIHKKGHLGIHHMRYPELTWIRSIFK
jgi:hypothetical protein